MKGYAHTRPHPTTISNKQATCWHYRVVDIATCTFDVGLVSAPMGGDRVKKGCGGMVPAASRLGGCLGERDLAREDAARVETSGSIVPQV